MINDGRKDPRARRREISEIIKIFNNSDNNLPVIYFLIKKKKMMFSLI